MFHNHIAQLAILLFYIWCHLHTRVKAFLVAAHGSLDIGGSIRVSEFSIRSFLCLSTEFLFIVLVRIIHFYCYFCFKIFWINYNNLEMKCEWFLIQTSDIFLLKIYSLHYNLYITVISQNANITRKTTDCTRIQTRTSSSTRWHSTNWPTRLVEHQRVDLELRVRILVQERIFSF